MVVLKLERIVNGNLYEGRKLTNLRLRLMLR